MNCQQSFDSISNTKIIFDENYQGEVHICGICGNISVGKSKFLDKINTTMLESYPEIHVVFEPVETWGNFKDSNGTSILEEFYSKTKEMAFTFQIFALQTRFETLERESKIALEKSKKLGKPVIMIIERTILDDFHIFAKMLFKASLITEFEMMVYNKWFLYYVTKFDIKKVVYLKTSPEICFERISLRNRDGESNISLEYLQDCHDHHEEFYKNVLINYNCLVIDNTYDKETSDYTKSILETVTHFTK